MREAHRKPMGVDSEQKRSENLQAQRELTQARVMRLGAHVERVAEYRKHCRNGIGRDFALGRAARRVAMDRLEQGILGRSSRVCVLRFEYLSSRSRCHGA